VDSEDLPLSLSREKPQNSALLRRIKDVLTRKFLRFLSDEAKNNPESYREFYVEYHMFLKEGLCQDYAFTESLSKLLLFESSAADAGQVISLDDYISRCPPEQKHIYYLVAPSREAALQSPYYETFRKHKKEVLFLYNTIDDFVMSNINTFAGKGTVTFVAMSERVRCLTGLRVVHFCTTGDVWLTEARSCVSLLPLLLLPQPTASAPPSRCADLCCSDRPHADVRRDLHRGPQQGGWRRR
jgi:hypothetical protein